MDTDKTTEGDVDTTNNEGEGTEAETVTIAKSDWEKTNQTLGSLKKEVKDLRRPKEEAKETPQTNQKSDEALLLKLERMSLRQAGITDPEDVELARNYAKKWNMDIDDLVTDEDFKVKLDRQQSARANVQATSGVKGSGTGTSQAKNSPEYWIAKGVPPTSTDIPDNATRRKISAAFLKANKGGSNKTFYND